MSNANEVNECVLVMAVIPFKMYANQCFGLKKLDHLYDDMEFRLIDAFIVPDLDFK